MPQFSISDLSLNRRHPRRGIAPPGDDHPAEQRRLVLLSIEDYQRLKRGADPRQAHTLDTMPDDLFEGAKAALDPYEQQTETP
jgi:hypothetical protein